MHLGALKALLELPICVCVCVRGSWTDQPSYRVALSRLPHNAALQFTMGYPTASLQFHWQRLWQRRHLLLPFPFCSFCRPILQVHELHGHGTHCCRAGTSCLLPTAYSLLPTARTYASACRAAAASLLKSGEASRAAGARFL